MKGILRLVVVLGIISILSGFILAETSILTQPKIEEVAQARLEEAIFEVLPDAKEYQEVDGASIEMYQGYDDSGDTVGIAFIAQEAGFQGDISIMVGMNVDDEILTGVSILSHAETPGLGAKITEGFFTDQFKNKPVSDEYQVKEDVDAITGATVSSKAVAKALKDNIEIALEEYKKGGGNQ
ncbi:MAG: RnfABCDGE type electron transport complex subunit G [Clostridia bacterium]|nr:RnfABCDGE type electron transport complex subunit G [Clostridia bacterium]